jgi:6,7-dimethyl-8-ribityllumazine synthase
MLQTQNVDAVIAIGSVIQGETKHFDFVCEGVAHKRFECSNGYSCYFCVLTDNTMQQSIDRSGGIHGNKGTEAAIAAIKMAFIRQQAL